MVQAQALLWAADGVANEEIARRCEVDSDTVRRWRTRFADRGSAGVGVIAKGRGRKSVAAAGHGGAEVVRLTLTSEPRGRLDALDDPVDGRAGRDRQGHGGADLGRSRLKPWKVDTFKVSNDPRFEEKLVDVVGLYLNPPARAVVFSFDEKTQCQALDRTQPSLPMKPGGPAR